MHEIESRQWTRCAISAFMASAYHQTSHRRASEQATRSNFRLLRFSFLFLGVGFGMGANTSISSTTKNKGLRGALMS